MNTNSLAVLQKLLPLLGFYVCMNCNFYKNYMNTMCRRLSFNMALVSTNCLSYI